MVCGIRHIPIHAPAIRRISPLALQHSRGSVCGFHIDSRIRASNVWMPTALAVKKSVSTEREDTTDLLARAAFVRKAYSGLFHMLPLGLRVQDKIERLIDKYMRSLGASKVSLSSISSQSLWTQSGRLTEDSDVFRFRDRKGSPFLLAPTHEEEITTLVGSLSTSYRQLPIRVYQISRKYRDEPRPRQGLLRGREFVMKDLYTFDATAEDAMKTYHVVRSAYTQLFDELKLPYLVAEANSGNMGGNLSHEFVLPSSQGEDSIISCSDCDLVYNEEVADGRASAGERPGTQPASGFDTGDTPAAESPSTVSSSMWMGISSDKKTLIRGWYPKYIADRADREPMEMEASSHAIEAISSAAGVFLDLGVENPLEQWVNQIKSDHRSGKTPKQRPRVLDLYDLRVRPFKRPPLGDIAEYVDCSGNNIEYSMLNRFPGTEDPLKLTAAYNGEQCSRCAKGLLTVHPAVELGHTFHLGTRYTEILKAKITVPETTPGEGGKSHQPGERFKTVPMHMGCHGIGVSRLITAVAHILSDRRGLNWPRVIAPYEVVVIAMPGQASQAEAVYDQLVSEQPGLDIILDDRNLRPSWLLKDADLIGYPVMVVVGESWRERQTVEIQCRQLEVSKEVSLDQMGGFTLSLLEKL